MGPNPSKEKKEKKPKKKDIAQKLKLIATELLTTERTYVQKLVFLDDVFQKELCELVPLSKNLSEDNIREIFSNLSQIRMFHETVLLPDLEARITEWDKNPKIGDLFKTNGHCLKMYTEYAKNYSNAITRVEKCMKKCKKFAARVGEIQKRTECEFTLENELIYPIQRIPRYKLLVNEYLSKLPVNSQDRAETEASLNIISQAADHVNDSMKQIDKFKKILEIETRISEGLKRETLVKPSRVFIKEGETNALVSSVGEVLKESASMGNTSPRTLILFNDLLLCCSKTTTGKLKVRQAINLTGITIETDDLSLPESGFRLRTSQLLLDIIATNDEERNVWVECITKAVDELSTMVMKRKMMLGDNSKLASVTLDEDESEFVS